MSVNRVCPTNAFCRFELAEIEQSVPSRFRHMVEKYPHRLALKDKYRALTYVDLDRFSDRVAAAVQHGCGSKRGPVALLFDHGVQAIGAILGVLKSGRPCVFLDPGLASGRNDFILADSGARFVVSDESNFRLANACRNVNAINIDECPEMLPKVKECTADAAACLVYTSGSTGEPKGVLQVHRNLLSVTMNYTNSFHVSHTDRLCFLYSPSVIAAVRVMWLALCNGAALCMYDLKAEGLVKLADWLRRERITLLTTVPSVFRQFTEFLTEADRFPDLRLIRLGGEPALPQDVAAYKRYFSDNCLLVNRIGSTETGTYSWYCMNKDTAVDAGSVPVGYPMEGYEVLLLGKDGTQVGENEIGEIVVRSRFLAAGYWQRHGLTNAAFAASPGGGGERIYRTGDQGRRHPDGCLVHMGRKDHQIKIRGHRVETAEVEKALLSLDGVNNAVVMPWQGKEDERCLVAYIEAAAATMPSVSTLRRTLGQILPGYMIPAYFVQLDKLPRAASGKINRGALPSPHSVVSIPGKALVAPRNPIEEQVARLWTEVLGLDEVSVHDSFLDLGGDSLRAMQLISRLLNLFGIELSMRHLLDSPTVADIAEVIALHKAEASTRRHGSPSHSDQSIPRRDTTDPGPLSFSQERLWLLSQFGEIGAAYNVPSAYRIRGPLNRNALEKALQTIVDRHAVLRTTYHAVDGTPQQIIHTDRTISLKIIDPGDCPQDPDEEQVNARLIPEIQRIFDLSRDLMIRAALLRIRDGDQILLLVVHHIASDGSGWSSRNVARELSRIYNAYAGGISHSLPGLPIQYVDFAEWQRGWLQGEVFEQQLSYWKECLAGSQALLPMPTDRPRPPRQTYRGAGKKFEFSARLLSALKALSRKEQTTLFMTLLAALYTLLHRYTGLNDIVVGSPTLGRNRIETEELIGFFGNMLVLRTDLSRNPTFRQLMQRVRKVSLAAYAHQDLPFEKLVAELQPERSLDHSPLFQVMFVLQIANTETPALTGLQVQVMRPVAGTAKYDLVFSVQERGGVLELNMEYNTDLFERATVDRMLGHYQTILESAARDPDQLVASLPLLPDRERQRLLFEWNATAQKFSSDACIHEIFEAQVARTPDTAAVLCAGERLTYRELNQCANHLAHRLQGVGVGPDVAVGICAGRSLEMVIGILAVLKAGGAYVPLDPGYPGERLVFMLKDAEVSVLLTQSSLLEKLPVHDARVVCLDSVFDTGAGTREQAPAQGATAGNLAYVIYTSGSTGKPKGVAMPHRALVNLITWQIDQSDRGEGSRTLQYASFGFDVSFQEIFSTWCAGGTLVMIDDNQRLDPVEMLRVIDKERVERVFLPYVALDRLSAAATALDRIPETLREVITAGEQLHITADISHLFARLPRCKLVNQYGPTEAHVVSFHALHGGPLNWPVLPPIGKPIANTRLYILDANLQPVPVGVPGELHIGGACLARGYVHRSRLTAERFISNPFDAAPGARLYKTGDRARYLPDGNIVYLGRVDDQVKIRGFRVEPGEIEAVLREHPAVRECVVLAREDAPGDKRLAAYAVAGERRTLTTKALRDFLKGKLPDYMLPTIVMLDALPLTPNGGIDRCSFPVPETVTPETINDLVAPRTKLEKELAGIWAGALRLDKVGIYDNFFELGGHSLMATQVINRVREQMGLELPLLTIFELPTIAEMANSIQPRAEP